MSYLIRKMKDKDLTEAYALLEKWNMAPMPDNPNAERSGIEVNHAFVAIKDNKIVGMSSYFLLSEDVAETASLAVDPEYKGLGLGFKLHEARIQEMKERGIKKVHTETDRPETIQWYKDKFGYKEVGKNPKKHNFSLLEVDEWTILELELSPG